MILFQLTLELQKDDFVNTPISQQAYYIIQKYLNVEYKIFYYL